MLKSKLNLHRIIIRSTKIRLYVSDNANPVCGGQFIAVNQSQVESIGRERTDVAVRAKIHSNIYLPFVRIVPVSSDSCGLQMFGLFDLLSNLSEVE